MVFIYMSSLFLIKVLEVFSKKRLSHIEESKAKTPNSIMKSKLRALAEKLRNGQTVDDKILLVDTSGPTTEDSVH